MTCELSIIFLSFRCLCRWSSAFAVGVESPDATLIVKLALLNSSNPPGSQPMNIDQYAAEGGAERLSAIRGARRAFNHHI
jgi:hypothetical protein